MIKLRKIQVFLKLLRLFFIFLNTKTLKDILFRKASIFVAEMSLLENPKLNASKCQMKKFSVLLKFTFFMSLQKINFLFDGRLPRNRICWVGLYLQGKGDYKYCWLIEKTGQGIHHP